MAETDWGFFGAAAADIARGVTAAFTKPNDGGSFAFGFNSKVAQSKAVGLYYNHTNFSPLQNDAAQLTGGSIRGALMRSGASVNPIGFYVGLYINLATPSETSEGYVLGLSSDSPSRIVLAKMMPSVELSTSLANPTKLAVSSASFLPDTWVHLRLDSIVNPNGDVVLRCLQNNMSNHPVTAPVWEAIPGISDFVDDALGINSGSLPRAGGYLGFCFQSSIAGGRAFVDHVSVRRAR
jgi:hypothetical protein